MKHLTDQELMKIVQAGDYSPGAEIYDRYSDRIYKFARNLLQNDALAADATQEVFLRMLKHANTYRAGSSLVTWLFAITVNQCRDHFRRSSTRYETEPVDMLRGVPSELYDAPDRQVEREWNAKVVNAALASLKPDLREAILLFRYERMSHAEIAVAVGCSVAAVKGRIFRGMDLMRQYIERRWPSPRSAAEAEAVAPATTEPVEEPNV
jgi:RNA polymerase sigma-70 factor (ECF subfamily)